MKIWGHGIQEPLIGLEEVFLSKYDIQLLSADKNPTLKFKLPNGVECIKFHSSREEFDALTNYDSDELNYGNIVNIVGRASINEWQGRKIPQLIIKEYEQIRRDYNF